jgi:hypothetical protein
VLHGTLDDVERTLMNYKLCDDSEIWEGRWLELAEVLVRTCLRHGSSLE